MKYIIISTLLLVFTSCATITNKEKQVSQDDSKPAIPSTIISTQNIEVSHLGF